MTVGGVIFDCDGVRFNLTVSKMMDDGVASAVALICALAGVRLPVDDLLSMQGDAFGTVCWFLSTFLLASFWVAPLLVTLAELLDAMN